MSLNQSDIMFIRSLPYPQSTEEVPSAIQKFTHIVFHPLKDTDKFIKIIRKAIKADMFLPVYIRPLTEQEIELSHAGAGLIIEAEEKEEQQKILKEMSKEERANMQYLLFMERLYS